MTGLVWVAAAMANGTPAAPTVPPGCVAAVQPGTIALYLEEAESRLAELDHDGFGSAVAAATNALPCAAAPLTPTQAASWHRVMGVRAFYAQDTGVATSELQAFRADDPSGELPTRYTGEGGRLLPFFREAVASVSTSSVPVVLPEDVVLWVDGARATDRPVGRAAVLQLVRTDGAPLASLSWRPGDPAPDLPALVAAAEVALAPPGSILDDAARVAHAHPLGLVVASGASALLATGAWAGSWYLRSRFMDETGEPVDVQALPGLRAGTNATVIAAPVLGATALTLGAVAVIRW